MCGRVAGRAADGETGGETKRQKKEQTNDDFPSYIPHPLFPRACSSPLSLRPPVVVLPHTRAVCRPSLTDPRNMRPLALTHRLVSRLCSPAPVRAISDAAPIEKSMSSCTPCCPSLTMVLTRVVSHVRSESGDSVRSGRSGPAAERHFGSSGCDAESGDKHSHATGRWGRIASEDRMASNQCLQTEPAGHCVLVR